MQGNSWIIIGYIIMAIGLLVGNIFVYHGNEMNQKQNIQKIIDQQKKSENRISDNQNLSEQKILQQQKISENSIINELKREMQKTQKKDAKEFSSQFPDGYQLFGIIDKQIIPSQKPSSDKIEINWSTAKILNVTKDLIEIQLPDAILPGNISFKGNIVRLNNKEGATSSGAYVINGWSTFVKILKSDGNKIIVVVGYKKIG